MAAGALRTVPGTGIALHYPDHGRHAFTVAPSRSTPALDEFPHICASARNATVTPGNLRSAGGRLPVAFCLAAAASRRLHATWRRRTTSRDALPGKSDIAVSCSPRVQEEIAEDDAWERFSSWVVGRGADVNAIKLGQVDGLRGVLATRDIAAGETIMEVPITASFELTDATADAGDPSVPAISLLRQYREQPSGFEPYFDLFAPVGSPALSSMPDFFTEEELAMLQCPPVVQKTRRRQELCACRAAEHGFQVSEVQWALCTVAQRSFTVLSPVDGLLRLLLPGVDFFNHDADSSHALRVRWQLEGLFNGSFKVVAGSEIKAGEEIRICYGGSPYRPDGCGGDCHGDIALTNEHYLQRYGFIDRSFGTTMVDGRWLVADEAQPVREALSQTSIAEDERLLANNSTISVADRTAVEFRLHLKRALAAQIEADRKAKEAADMKAAADAKSQADSKANVAVVGEPPVVAS